MQAQINASQTLTARTCLPDSGGAEMRSVGLLFSGEAMGLSILAHHG